MSKIKLIINRLKHRDLQTLGSLLVYEDALLAFNCCSLELPDRDNQKSISRVDAGRYTGKRRWSEKYGDHIHIQDVEGRTLILIHFGNYYTQTEGCVLVGLGFYDINKDGYSDVTNSRAAMRQLMNFLPQEFDIIINDY